MVNMDSLNASSKRLFRGRSFQITILSVLGLGVIGAILFLIVHFYNPRLEIVHTDDSLYSYATVEWVEEIMEKYASGLVSDDEIMTITKSISDIDSRFLAVDSDNISSEDLRKLYYYVDQAIATNVRNLPDETVSELSNAILFRLISQYNIDLTDQELKNINNDIADIQFELSLIKDSLPGKSLNGLSESEIRQIVNGSGLSKNKIESWIASSESDITSRYTDADEHLEDLLKEAYENMDVLYNDSVYLNNAKMDISDAEKRLEDVNTVLNELERSISELDSSSAGNDKELLDKLIATQELLLSTKEELESIINDNKSDTEAALQSAKTELTNVINSNRSQSDAALKSAKNEIQSSFDSTNTRIGDIENKNLLQYQLDTSDPDNPVLILTPVQLQANQ